MNVPESQSLKPTLSRKKISDNWGGSRTSMVYRSIACQILKTGITPVSGTYYLCECDSERRNPICEECFKNCHKGKDHKEIKRILNEEVCMCGFKYHQPMNHSETSDLKYTTNCLFGEWLTECNYPIYYKDKKSLQSSICLLCKNICYKNATHLVKTTFNKEIVDPTQFQCTCSHHNHNDIKIIFRKLKSISKKNNFKSKYDFNDLCFVQVINMIMSAPKSFENIFHSFNDKLNETIEKINTYPEYALEDHKFFNDLHLTCNILSNFSNKSRNVYSLSDEIHGSNLNLSRTTKVYYINSKTLVYFRSEIKQILTLDKYFIIMEKEFDFKSRNIWILKQYITNIFWKFCIAKDFTRYPNIKLRDMQLLNPLQRIMMISNIKKENSMNEYFNNLNKNILDSILALMWKILKTKEKQPEIMLIYNKLYKICQLFAKFSLFNYEQVTRFCNLNNKLILSFIENIKEDKKSIEQQKLKFKVLSPMMKCIVHLAINYNDQMLLSYLKKERELHNVNFFHLKCESSKITSQNAINCLSLIQELTPEYEIEELQDIALSDIGQNFSKKKTMTIVPSLRVRKEIITDYEDANKKKCLRNIVRNAHWIIHLILGIPEFYLTSLTRLSQKNQEINFKYVINNISIDEQDFISSLKEHTENLENEYLKAFDTYITPEFVLESNLKTIMTSIVNTLRIGDNSNKHNNYNGTSVCLDEERLLKEDIKEKNILSKLVDNSTSYQHIQNIKTINPKGGKEEGEIEPKFKHLINKTYLMQSAFKVIEIMYAFFNERKSSQSLFRLDNHLFKSLFHLSLFYVKEDIDNAMAFLMSDYMSAIELLNTDQLRKMLTVVHVAVKTIHYGRVEISINSNLIHLIKIAIVKAMKSISVFDQVLKIIQILTQINFNHEFSTSKKLRKVMITIYSKFDHIHIYLKNLTKQTNQGDLIDDQPEDIGLESSNNKRNNEEIKINIKNTIKKFLRIVNILFCGNSGIEERMFLEQILSKKAIKMILKNYSLDLSIRTEILCFYRITYIDTVMKKSNSSYYTSLLINDPFVLKNEETIDNPKYYKFYENLIKSSNTEQSEYISEECEVIKNELINYKSILDCQIKRTEAYIINYVELGILKSLNVYLSKFSSLIFDCTGYDYINLYELLYYFLEFKKYIYEHKELFTKDTCITYKNVFRNALSSWDKKHHRLINSNISMEDLKKVNEDLDRMKKANFEILNFTLMSSMFAAHFENFISMPKLNGLKTFFEKRSHFYDEEQIEKKKKYLTEHHIYNTDFHKEVFEVIIKYFDDKNNLDHSTFCKMLEDDNMLFNVKYRQLLIKNILFYMRNYNYEETYGDYSLWELFRLLQYNTSETQKSCLELKEKKSSLLNFDYLLRNFTLNLMSVFIRKINPSVSIIRHDYFVTLMIVKILKYYCEEHNQDFQRIFFIKEEEDGLVLHYNPKQYEFQFCDKKIDDKTSETDNNSHHEGLIEEERKNKKPNPDSECENFHEVTRSEENAKEIQKNKASVFEYMLSILGKIILLSKWIISKDTDSLDDYYYDLYFVILEFLIETIQGTRYENLQTVFVHDENGRNLFGLFLLDINRLMLEENDSLLSYQVRKDMMDFLMAFLEESATPPNGIIEISSVILPISILDSIVSTMSKLYDIRLAEIENDESSTLFTTVNENSLTKLKSAETVTKKNFKFTPEMKVFFTKLYFNNSGLEDDIMFALANRMYQFFKLYSLEDSFRNPAVCEFYDKMSQFNESKIMKFYYNQNKNCSNDEKNSGVADSRFFENFLCVSFFESITRMVFVNKSSEDKPVRVLFTLNPVVPLLSSISKEDFIDNVDRSDRYIKLFSLMERCDYFFEEVFYKQSNGKKGLNLRFITDLNFYWLEVFAFVITLAINLVMIFILNGEGDALYGDQSLNKVVYGLGWTNFLFNILSVILWLCSKFTLFYLTECSKMLKKKEKEKNEDDDSIVSITIWEKIKATYIVLIEKNKLIGFAWNIGFSAGAIFSGVNFLYIVQLFIIVNLSQTLRNLILSLTLKANQLFAVFYCMIVFNLVFAAIAFFNFSEDFIRPLDSKPPKPFPEPFRFLADYVGSPYEEPSHVENECGTILYCFATHLDYGMRFDGGIADRMAKRSFTYHQAYYVSRFFYEEFYFILLVVLMLNMIFGIIIEAFSELRNNEQKIEKDKKEICFICGIDKESCEKKGEKLEEHLTQVHNIWTYVEYMLGLRFVDIQETNAINSYVIENLERKELVWFPYDEIKTCEEDQNSAEDD